MVVAERLQVVAVQVEHGQGRHAGEGAALEGNEAVVLQVQVAQVVEPVEGALVQFLKDINRKRKIGLSNFLRICISIKIVKKKG